MSDARDLIASIDFKSDLYSEICDEIHAKLIKFITNVVRVAPLSEIILGYAGLDSLGLFMYISAIHMSGVDVVPIGTKYTICFGLVDKDTYFSIRAHGRIPTYNADGSATYDHYMNDTEWHHFPTGTMHALAIKGDALTIGDMLGEAMNKPWWGANEKQKVGTAALYSLTLKAKLLLWRFMRRGL